MTNKLVVQILREMLHTGERLSQSPDQGKESVDWEKPAEWQRPRNQENLELRGKVEN